MRQHFLTISFTLFLSTGLLAQQNLGVGQANPQGKIHVTQEGSQAALIVEDQALDPTPFMIDADGNVDVGGKITTDSLMVPHNAAEGHVLTSDVNGNATWQPVLPAGVIMPYMGTTPPPGWLLCDGSEVSRTSYANLFTIIGTSNGSGDGASTFHLPDFRGRFLRGADNGAGNDPDAASRTALNSGGNTGDAIGSYQADGFKSHYHWIFRAVTSSSAMGSGYTGAPAMEKDIGTSNDYNITIGGGTANAGRTSTTGGNETRPVNVSVNYIIKY